jgi:LPS O-antigen subunit length determinant protein (WzzB/FepE family)
MCCSKQTSIEIEQLSARVVEAETKLKTEVTRIKKKLQIQITELEMSLDVANKNNIELQKTIKKQSLSLTVSTGTHISHCTYAAHCLRYI